MVKTLVFELGTLNFIYSVFFIIYYVQWNMEASTNCRTCPPSGRAVSVKQAF
jgi:hypothetical protein